jgi:hypothetical protein
VSERGMGGQKKKSRRPRNAGTIKVAWRALRRVPTASKAQLMLAFPPRPNRISKGAVALRDAPH